MFIVNTGFLFQKSTNFILRNLEANSLYYIQVQAITVPYGLKKKLVSDKAVVFINTKEYRNGKTFNDAPIN